MELIENKYNELTQYVPKQQWENDSRQQLIYEKLTNRLNWLESIFKEVVDNAFIKTMNEEALSKAEKEFNIIPSLDQTLEDRKAVLISTLRGIGVTNIARIKYIVESFTNGKVEVITDNPHYFFKVKFVSELGIPPRINDVRKAIEKVIPCHLGVSYEFKYNTVGYIKEFTVGEISKYTVGEVLTEDLGHGSVVTSIGYVIDENGDYIVDENGDYIVIEDKYIIDVSVYMTDENDDYIVE